MYCSKCGTEIQEGKNYCADCGRQAGESIYTYKGKDYQKDDINKIAKYQKRAIYICLGSIVLFLLYFAFLAIVVLADAPDFISEPFQTVSQIVSLIWTVIFLINIILLTVAEKCSALRIAFTVIASFIPVICLIALLMAITEATGIMRSAGLKVGLMGVSPVELYKFNNNIAS